ncbi:hypothetical protein JRO89_XS05G0144200 [Xanthoceras sorbifolium]|uniref:Uncharacterized protein n=1 Tax=Xanthoceras sorbifolium TaxID=99658 RepID=A0ABQ8I2D0_9ROSI|nr:hypothetical protein JRO89_XS05G0144200 [Xanthoceras sorbifolium]
MRMLSKTFRSVKHTNPNLSKPSSSSSTYSTRSQSQAQPTSNYRPKSRSWCVYLILSTNTPIKTYVGVTTNFSRRSVLFFFLSFFLLVYGDTPLRRDVIRCYSLELSLLDNEVDETIRRNFSLQQHNGELKGGAKASRAGRPWVSACIIRGFHDQSEGACLIHILDKDVLFLWAKTMNE